MVEGDSKTMEAYLNSRGDPTRKLSNPEAQLFAKPGPGVYNTNHQLSALKTCSQHPASDRPQHVKVEGWGQCLLLV